MGTCNQGYSFLVNSLPIAAKSFSVCHVLLRLISCPFGPSGFTRFKSHVELHGFSKSRITVCDFCLSSNLSHKISNRNQSPVTSSSGSQTLIVSSEAKFQPWWGSKALPQLIKSAKRFLYSIFCLTGQSIHGFIPKLDYQCSCFSEKSLHSAPRSLYPSQTVYCMCQDILIINGTILPIICGHNLGNSSNQKIFLQTVDQVI